MKKKLLFWIFVVLSAAWAGFILCRSMQPAEASDAESGVFLSFLQKIFPFVTMTLVRKAAHFTEFAILGSLLCGTMLCYQGKKNWLIVFLISLLTALADETVQLFVKGRSGQVSDVWLDFSGAFLAALVIIFIAHMRKKRRQKKLTQAEKAAEKRDGSYER